ncbi:MAG: branched-chain amino acid ABC transporter permease [Syntrophobacteraceae bacterium]
MDVGGIFSYLIFFLVIASIYGLLSLGLNIQWGYTKLFNIGIAGFFAVGAYSSAILTTPASPGHLGGFNLPFPVALVIAVLLSGLVAFVIGLPTLRLREDYLAIATIGIAETIRLIFNNEDWLANGVRGVSGIPRPFERYISFNYNLFYLMLMVALVIGVYLALEIALKSPWGRVLKAIGEDEAVTQAMGKNVFRYKMESLVLGSMIMGMAGSLYAHFIQFISPEVFVPMTGTFLVWVMLIAGGSGSNKGALLGAVVIWGVWSLTGLISNVVPIEFAVKAGALRVIVIAIFLEVILIVRPQGILGEKRVLRSARQATE